MTEPATPQPADGSRGGKKGASFRAVVGASVKRQQSFRDARSSAKNLIAHGKGLPNRPAGAFSVPPDGMSEPERTERILRAPFTLCHQVAGDAFQARLGFQLFRVNALSPIGYSWRFIVLLVNVTIGVIGGLSPLIAPRGPTSTEAIIQVRSLGGRWE